MQLFSTHCPVTPGCTCYFTTAFVKQSVWLIFFSFSIFRDTLYCCLCSNICHLSVSVYCRGIRKAFHPLTKQQLTFPVPPALPWSTHLSGVIQFTTSAILRSARHPILFFSTRDAQGQKVGLCEADRLLGVYVFFGFALWSTTALFFLTLVSYLHAHRATNLSFYMLRWQLLYLPFEYNWENKHPITCCGEWFYTMDN